MNQEKSIKIESVGKYVPKQVLSSQIETKFQIPQGWSEKYSGVYARHHATFESIAYMGARAIEKALEKSKINLSEIDLLISAGASFDYPLPNQSSVIKSELKEGLKFNFPTIDIDATCLSFVSAFEIAASLLDGKKYKKIAIVSSEISSKGLNPKNWETLTLFGDGAVSVILVFDEKSDSKYIASSMKTYSEGVNDTIFQGGGNQYFFKDFPFDPELHSLKMNGKKLLRLAKNKIPDFIKDFFENIPYSIDNMEVIIPHQASKTGIQILSNLFPKKSNVILGNLKTHGNCIAASIPMTLYDGIENGQIKRGDTCFLIGTSAGVSIGGLLIKY